MYRLNAPCRLILIGLAGLIFFACGKGKAESEEERIRRIKEQYRSQIRKEYTIENSASSREEAVRKFLESISILKTGAEPDFYCSEKEYKEIFLPNTVDENTLTSYMDTNEAWKITKIRRDLAFTDLNAFLKGKNFTIKKFIWSEKPRELHSLRGHVLKKVLLESGKDEIEIDSVRLVIEHRNQFKVCVVAK